MEGFLGQSRTEFLEVPQRSSSLPPTGHGLQGRSRETESIGGSALVVFVFFVFRLREGWAAEALRRTFSAVAVRPAVAAIVLALLLHLLLLLLLLELGSAHDAVIVLGMLEVILRHHPIANRVGVARELKIFLIDMCGRATNFDLRTGRIESPVRVVLRSATAPTRAFHLSPFVSGRP